MSPARRVSLVLVLMILQRVIGLGCGRFLSSGPNRKLAPAGIRDLREGLMRSLWIGVVLVTLAFALPASAQVPVLGPPAPIAGPVRDEQAVTAIQNAINALGGDAQIGLQQSWVVQGNVTGNTSASIPSGTFIWEAAGSEYRFAGHGKPNQISAGKSQALPQHMARAMFVPALVGPVLLQELQNQSYSIRYAGTDTIGTKSVVMVTTAAETTYPDNVVTPQTWYFDSSTWLPVRVDFRSPAPKYAPAYITERFDYSDFRAVAGAIFPFQMSLSINGNGVPLQAFSVKTISINTAIVTSDFEAPAGGVL
jgi:hypothetical protein